MGTDFLSLSLSEEQGEWGLGFCRSSSGYQSGGYVVVSPAEETLWGERERDREFVREIFS